MKAITVTPRQTGSARLEEIPEPELTEGPVLVETVAVGVCGTDRDILAGTYGTAAPRPRGSCWGTNRSDVY